MSIFDKYENFIYLNDGTLSKEEEEEEEKKRQEQLCELMYEYQQYKGIIKQQQYVLRGSKLQCQYGTRRVLLDCLEDYGICKSGLPFLTTQDCKIENIHNFGSCLCPEENYLGRLPMTVERDKYGNVAKKASCNVFSHICVPLIDEEHGWRQIDTDLLVAVNAQGYAPMLLDNAVLVCQYGGIITIEEVPMVEVNEDEQGKIITFPDCIKGELNGKEKKLYPNDNWYSYQCTEKGTAKDSTETYYKIVVGPKILDTNYPDNGKLWPMDFGMDVLNVRVDVELELKNGGNASDSLILKCIACGLKAHTYNIHPDKTLWQEHKLFEYNKNITASFQVENGFVQTGIAYPNCWNAQKDDEDDGPIAINHMNGSVIEFCGTQVDFEINKYKLVKVIVLDGE